MGGADSGTHCIVWEELTVGHIVWAGHIWDTLHCVGGADCGTPCIVWEELAVGHIVWEELAVGHLALCACGRS